VSWLHHDPAVVTWWSLALWLALALIHGLWRSTGAAEQDPIRPPGPIVPS
jgi:hypothetical protein